jgi:hypothetical protein
VSESISTRVGWPSSTRVCFAPPNISQVRAVYSNHLCRSHFPLCRKQSLRHSPKRSPNPLCHSPRFLSRWGSLFEDTRGLAAVSGPDSAPYFPSGSGTLSKNPPAPGADRTAAGDDVAGHVTPRQRLVAKARVSYRAIELARMIAYALLLGGFGKSQHSLGQIVAVLAVAVVQVVSLLLIRVSASRFSLFFWFKMFLL